MRNATKQVLLPLLVLAFLHPVSAFACATVSKEQAAAMRLQRIEEFKKAASAMKEDADLVFVGRLSQLTSSQETVKSASGHDQVMQTYQAVFNADQAIKGQYPKGQVLEYTINKTYISIDCGTPFVQFPKETGVGETYLVYAKAGKLLRTNHIHTDAQTMGGRDEAAFIGERIDRAELAK